MLIARTALTLVSVATLALSAAAAADAKPPKRQKAPVPAVATVLPVALQGGATGDGPATNRDCEQIAHVITKLQDMAFDSMMEGGELDTAIGLLDQAADYERQGDAAGCFFY